MLKNYASLAVLLSILQALPFTDNVQRNLTAPNPAKLWVIAPEPVPFAVSHDCRHYVEDCDQLYTTNFSTLCDEGTDCFIVDSWHFTYPTTDIYSIF